MGILLQIRAMFSVALKRLFAQRGLALATTIGLTVSVSLVRSIPLYADATHFRILRDQITGEQGLPTYAPLTFLCRYAGSRSGGWQWADVFPVDQYLSQSAGRDLGLPETSMVRLFKTTTFQLFPPLDPNVPESQYFLTWVSLGFLNEPEKNIRLVDGAYPSPSDASPDGPIEILVHGATATEFGVLVGDTYFARRDSGLEIPVRVIGLWTAADPLARVWTIDTPQLALMSEPAFVNRVTAAIEDELFQSSWYLVMDGSRIHAGDVAGLLPPN